MDATPIKTRAHIRTLQARLAAQLDELRGCTTDAARLCLVQAIDDTNRQLREAKAAAPGRYRLCTSDIGLLEVLP